MIPSGLFQTGEEPSQWEGKARQQSESVVFVKALRRLRLQRSTGLTPPSWANRASYLEDLYVKPEARGKGVGFALLRRFAGIAIERGWGRVEWEVLQWNESSIRFYQRLGAVPKDAFAMYRLTGPAYESWRRKPEPARPEATKTKRPRKPAAFLKLKELLKSSAKAPSQ